MILIKVKAEDASISIISRWEGSLQHSVNKVL